MRFFATHDPEFDLTPRNPTPMGDSLSARTAGLCGPGALSRPFLLKKARPAGGAARQEGQKQNKFAIKNCIRRLLSLAAEDVCFFAQKRKEIIGENTMSDFRAFIRVYIWEQK